MTEHGAGEARVENKVEDGPSCVSPTASTITVSETVSLCLTKHPEVVEGLCLGDYALWAGSGISRDRVPDVPATMERLVEHLRQRAADEPSFARALEAVLDLAMLTQSERASTCRSTPVSSWGCVGALRDRLSNSYSKVLEISVDGQPDDYMLCEAAAVPRTFGTVASPDVEHYCIAILGLEGLISQVVTPNWDGLIECAFEELQPGASGVVLRTCVAPDDVRAPSLRCRILKVHGCAVRAKNEPDRCRKLLVGRQADIDAWMADEGPASMRLEALSLATRSRTLMVGLSAQDANVRQIFIQAKNKLPWHWPDVRPAYVFAEDALQSGQRSVLIAVYRDEFQEHAKEIQEASHIRAFGKPLLLSLVLLGLAGKVGRWAEEITNALAVEERQVLRRAPTYLAQQASQHAGPDTLSFATAMIRFVATWTTILREGHADVPVGNYRPLSIVPADQAIADHAFITSGLCQVSLVLALLGRGAQEGYWRVTVDVPGGALLIGSGDAETEVFCVANETAYVALTRARKLSSSTVVVHGHALARRRVRTPKRAPGRTGRRGARSVVAPTLASVQSLDAMMRMLRQEAVL